MCVYIYIYIYIYIYTYTYIYIYIYNTYIHTYDTGPGRRGHHAPEVRQTSTGRPGAKQYYNVNYCIYKNKF